MRPPSVPTTIPTSRDDDEQVANMKSLYNSLIEHRESGTRRILVSLFMCLPSRKDFPEYFNVIKSPIAMNKIRERIEKHTYPDEDSCVEDFKLMFRNCKQFNEDDSQIYQDAVVLEETLKKKRAQIRIEQSRPSRESKDAAKEAILNVNNSNSTTAVKIENSNNINGSSTTATRSISSDHNETHSSNNKTANSNHNNSISNFHPTSNAADSSADDSNSKKNGNSTFHQSDSINHSKADSQPKNGQDDAESTNINITHNHHNETSMDSSSNLSADLLASTPVEKCSLNTRRGRNPDAPKRQLLTGYIIYASEVRKQVIDKNPNQNFGDISRLVGNKWKALPHDIRSQYDQRALIHNKRVRDKNQREQSLSMSADGRLPNGMHTPKMTKRKLAKLAKEQMRQHHLSLSAHDDSMTNSPRPDFAASMASQNTASVAKCPHQSQPQTTTQVSSGKHTTTETSTQTTIFRFVEPPTKKRLVYSETFRKYIEGLQVPNKDLLAEETAPERPPELPSSWLGAGVGRHESPEAALWALRDFMLQDAITMRRSMDPYL